MHEKESLSKIGILISKKQCKFHYFASDKLYYISEVKID